MRRRRNGDNRPLLVVLEAFKGFVQKLYDARKALDASQATATAKEQAERVRAAMQKLVLTLGNSDVMRREIDDDSLSAKDVLKSHMQRAKSRNAMQKGGFFSRLFGGNKRDSTSGGSSKNLAQKIDRVLRRIPHLLLHRRDERRAFRRGGSRLQPPALRNLSARRRVLTKRLLRLARLEPSIE